MHVLFPGMLPLEIDAIFPLDICLTYHPDLSRVVRVRCALDWVVETLTPRVFPWFREEFIPPKDLPALSTKGRRSRSFAAWTGRHRGHNQASGRKGSAQLMKSTPVSRCRSSL